MTTFRELIIKYRHMRNMTDAPDGLSESLAAERLRSEGPNELPTAKPKGIFRITAEVLREPMLLLLIATGAVYVVLGSVKEAAALGVSVLVVVGITLYQEAKTERTLQALRDLSSPRALVIRDGHRKRIAGREVVRGDLLVLSEGDRAPRMRLFSRRSILLRKNPF